MSNRLFIEMVLLLSRFSMIDPKYLSLKGAKKRSHSNHLQVNAMEIQQSMTEMSVMRINFGLFKRIIKFT